MNTCNHELSKPLRLLFLSFGIILILCSVWVVAPELVDGTVTGKIGWFMLVLPFFGIITGLSVLSLGRNFSFVFSIADGLVGLNLLWFVLTYDYGVDPAPDKFWMTVQLAAFWFVLRIALQTTPALYLVICAFLLVSGFVETIWGIRQLHGYSVSNHFRFLLTGSFFNPGPYSGYLTMVLPMVLSIGWWSRKNQYNILFYLMLGGGILMLTVLPAGMSRAAWIAGLLSCGWVGGMHCGRERIVKIFKQIQHRRSLLQVGIILCAGALVSLYTLKKDSADGRFFMAKLTARAIVHQPLTGTGAGGFAYAYAQEQQTYFATEKASETEERIAGSPDYAFNEYLQIALEQGIPGLLLFVGLLATCFVSGIRNKRIAPCGALLSVAIFALASYPLQLPSFGITLVCLLALCVQQRGKVEEEEKNKSIHRLWLVSGFLWMVVAGTFFVQHIYKDSYIAYKRWNGLKPLYDQKAYKLALDGYEDLYRQLHASTAFLFEYAQCLYEIGRYTDAIQVLQRAVKLTDDPMVYNVLAKNYQATGQYHEAEQWLLRSMRLLPGRIYPYYLLARLYADPGYDKPDKCRQMATIVLTKQPKVNNSAIQTMRSEMKELLLKMNFSPVQQP